MTLAGDGSGGKQLEQADWVQVVIVAGIGSVLEWLDFYNYSLLDATLKDVFFKNETGYWTCFGLAMAARPCGALLFGHIGDTRGRTRALMLGILLMAGSTAAIGCLPTYDVGPYTAGVAAPILLCIFRVLQGLAMGGEFGVAITYVSEMAGPARRCTLTALLQTTTLVGMLLSLSLIMVLQATISPYDMDIWGWRIPFCLAFVTALLGIWMRRGLPEPHSFLEAARAERHTSSDSFSQRQRMVLGEGAEWQAASQGEQEGKAGSDVEASESGKGSACATSAGADAPGGVHPGRGSNVARSKVPFMRVIVQNWAAVLIQTCYSAWVGASFYTYTSWLPSKLRAAKVVSVRASQGILLASIPTCAVGYMGMGWALDRGLRAVYANVVLTAAGSAAGFGVLRGSFTSALAAWLVSPAMLFLVGATVPLVGLPCTRMYSQLERVSGYSFGYNLAMGVIGGFTPNINNAIKGSLPADLEDYAAAFWLLGVGALSIAGSFMLQATQPKINQRFVGHLE